MHDVTVDRTTNGTGAVSDLTFAEIRALDAADKYPDLQGTGILVPTLDEFLHEFAHKKEKEEGEEDLLFLFDVKDVRVVPRIRGILDKWEIHDRVLFCAVESDVNVGLKNALPPTSPITPDIASMMKLIACYAVGLDWLIPMAHPFVGCVAIDFSQYILTEKLIASWKSRGYPVFLFGPLLDDPAIMKKYKQWGADLLLTDRPDYLRELIDSQKEGREADYESVEVHRFVSSTNYFAKA
eukprot:TRINITY_DN3783_c0_g1_i2.p1 TRINITY_DN3783_c0_g1~~TRINITY_DN3783_c0_g1_i2.p1  ORF type:complete len:239 (+),score=53.10 TRINITY_DN3783_c0_g1_i2:517-1233(+)